VPPSLTSQAVLLCREEGPMLRVSVRGLSIRWSPLAHAAVVLLLVASGPASGQPAPDVGDRVDAFLAKYYELGLFNGAVLVADRGKVLLRKGYGLANMEWEIANTPDTKFRLGSITKQFTAALVMQEVERGEIELTAPITRYLPDYPADTGDRVTIHHLLNHTSGIVGYTELPGFAASARTSYEPAQFADEFFANLDLLFEPGTKYSYNNSAYFLLGIILEKVSGKPYAQLLQERIFTPLGMKDSGYDSARPLLSKRAAGYDKQFDGSYVNTSFLDMSLPYAAGALYSTVDDLYKWDQALYTDSVMSAASKDQMFTPGLFDYGYGWIIKQQDGVKTIEHGGGINGFNTFLTRNPDSKRLIVLLNNTGAAPLQAMAGGVRDILNGKQPAAPRVPAAPLLFKTYESSGLGAALAKAKELQSSKEYDASHGELSRLAEHLLAIGKNADALELANKLSGDAPKSAPAAALLARAHRANGNRIEAVQNYGRAIELSETPRAFPSYTHAIRELSTLDVKPK
jgi:CubicO group peptidase (beta-lactamase class C family)